MNLLLLAGRRCILSRAALGCLLLSLHGCLAATAADDPAINYNDHIKPIFRKHCLKCHGDDQQEAGLNLQNFQAALKGGSGGPALVAGRATASLLYQAITDTDPDSRMPPNQPALPNADLQWIRNWIDGGLLADSGAKALSEKRDLSFRPMSPIAAGEAVMPVDWAPVQPPQLHRKPPLVAMDTSPTAPLLAVGGEQTVQMLHTESRAVLGMLAFPEGSPHVIRFRAQGAVLLVAGGKPVQSGRVVLFDVQTGKRMAQFGDEIDAALAADLSPDQRLVALGGAGKVVKIYSTVDGALQFKLTRHTDWITAMAFSPDGSKLATADRSGGLHLWDTTNGGILLSLAEHKASIRSLQWRGDSRVLASGGEDGQLIWWDSEDGWPAISHPNAHPPQRPAGYFGNVRNGVLSVAFGPQGQLLTAGRDRVVRLWSPAGKLMKSFPIRGALPTITRISHDGQALIAGDAAGELHFLVP